MHLPAKTIELIRNGEKKIEARLFDEKRQKLSLGDEIEILDLDTKEHALTVVVEALLIYNNFQQLYADFDASLFGGEGWSVEKLVDNIYQFYDPAEEKEYGVVGIKIQPL